MPISKIEQEFVTYVVDIMQCIGPVESKRMFGGHGLFLGGLMFALISDDTLYLKTDDEQKSHFTDLELPTFEYLKQGKIFKLAYYQAPETALEESEEMATWANRAYEVALKANVKKKR